MGGAPRQPAKDTARPPQKELLAVRRRAARDTLFPYTTLFRSFRLARADLRGGRRFLREILPHALDGALIVGFRAGEVEDRKSTRLNSSHSSISYAVFCLKKKTPRRAPARRRPAVARAPAARER